MAVLGNVLRPSAEQQTRREKIPRALLRCMLAQGLPGWHTNLQLPAMFVLPADNSSRPCCTRKQQYQQ
jgi:hypothetical protein